MTRLLMLYDDSDTEETVPSSPVANNADTTTLTADLSTMKPTML